MRGRIYPFSRRTGLYRRAVLVVALVTGGGQLAATVAANASTNRHPALTKPAASTQIDWNTVGFNLQRTGENPDERTLSPKTVARLKELWSSGRGQWIEPSPVFAANVRVGDRTEDLVLDGSAHGSFFAFNASTGKIVWRRTLAWHKGRNSKCYATPWGITGSPVIDRSTGRIYVVDGSNDLYALSLSTGETVPGWPVELSHLNGDEHVWSGLTELRGVIYVALASNCDQGPYHGRLVAVGTRTAKITATFYADGPNVATGGGIWGWGGASVDTSERHLYVATGNATGKNTNAGYASSVVELDAGSLKVVGHNNPGITQGDNDFGSTPVLYHAPGCPPELAVENKLGYLYVYDQGAVSSGPVQSLLLSAPHVFIGDVAWSSVADLLYATIPESSAHYPHGIVALKPVRSGDTCDLTLAWKQRLGQKLSIVSPPTVANGVVYFGDGMSDTEYALNDKTGAILWRHKLPGYLWAAPIVVNGRLYVTDWDGDVFCFGLESSKS